MMPAMRTITRTITIAAVLAGVGLVARGQAPVPTSAPAPTTTPSAAPTTTTAMPATDSKTTDSKTASTAGAAKPEAVQTPGTTKSIVIGAPVQADSLNAQRKAAKLYLQGVQLLEKKQPEAAWGSLKQAVKLEPGNSTYLRASELARQSAVTQLVEQAGRERGSGAEEDAKRLLKHAQEIDPENPSVLQRLDDAEDKKSIGQVGITASSLVGPDEDLESGPRALADGPIVLDPKKDKQSFHLRTSSRDVVEQVFRAYGIQASVHDSVQARPIRLDVEDATFPQAMRILELLTHTFYEPLDPHRVVVAQDTRENRTQFQRLQLETIYLPGMNDKELTEVSNLAHNVFDAPQSVVEPTRGTLTLRAPAKTMDAFNRTVTRLVDGKSQVDLSVKIIQLAYTHSQETGTTFFQQTTVANVYSEINSILNQNQAAVQQIIASGIVPNANTLQNQLTIIEILIGSGQASLSGILTQGFALFGGGLTLSALAPGPATLNMNMNSSDTRILDDVHLRLQDQEAGTFKIGTRYPIQTSSFSPIAISALGSAGLQNETIPQVQYSDLGLTLKATPSVMRSDDVALTLDLKIDALSGGSINDIPILDSRQVSGVLTLKAGETAMLISDVSRSEARALSGLPGISDIPGLENISDIARSKSVARLLILVTPIVVRETQRKGSEPMLMVDKSANAH